MLKRLKPHVFESVINHRIKTNGIEKLNDIAINVTVNDELKEAEFEIIHKVYGRELDKIEIPEIKLPDGFWSLLVYTLLQFLPDKWLSKIPLKWRIVQEEKEIYLREYFPKMLVPMNHQEKPLYIVGILNGETLGHKEVKDHKNFEHYEGTITVNEKRGESQVRNKTTQKFRLGE